MTMLVTSDNLSGLVQSTSLCAPQLVDGFSIDIRLDAQVIRMKPGADVQPIVYGRPYTSTSYFEETTKVDRDLMLHPGDRVLACSADTYAMPCSHFGLIQTKGSLARLFVAVTCNDGQVEPGYKGRVTLEVMNHSNFAIAIPIGEVVAQLFVFRCTTESTPYAGRYQGAIGPTLADFGT